MVDLRNTVDGAKNWFDQLADKIPGYAGYREKDRRREADALLREHLAKEFGDQWEQLNDLKSQMLIGPGMQYLDDLGRVSRRLQTLIDKIKAAAQGYAGFFDAVKVEERQLDELYRFDNEMLDRVAEVAEAIDAVQAAVDEEAEIGPTIRALDRQIRDLINHYDRRKEVILGLI